MPIHSGRLRGFLPGYRLFRQAIRACALLAMLVALGGCASLEFDHPTPPSYALEDVMDTRLAQRIQPLAAKHPGQSGFTLLNDGVDALAARILLIQRAEKSIDAQYYFILDDFTGHLFYHELLKAADRGVRVRLLMDDIATQGKDLSLAAIDSHPNMAIRVFNPFSERKLRYLNLKEVARINRRMHNKSLIVDQQAIIVGGRNIGAEYFAARKDVNFRDLDVLGIGPAAADGSIVFDEYWNDPYALPVTLLAEPDPDPALRLERIRTFLAAETGKLQDGPYADALKGSVLQALFANPEFFEWANYQLVADPPGKSRSEESNEGTIVDSLRPVIQSARRDLMLVSPYFVPRKRGVEGFRSLRDRGIEVTVITNSLASTDVAAVHSGYAPARIPLLKMGVRLFEVRRDTEYEDTQRAGTGLSRSSLHTKAFVIDGEILFVGSFNFDPRSANLNTEMGMVIHAPRMASELVETVNRNLPEHAYRVFLNDKSRVRWESREDDEIVILTLEPQTSYLQRVVAGFLRLLPIKGQL